MTMRILLVEDDEDKREQLIEFVDENIDCDLKAVRSFQSGLRAIQTEAFDVLLLDMSMPTFDITSSEPGGRSQPFGGELLLFEMVRRKITSKVIVVTQFDLFGEGEEEITLKDLDLRLSNQFKDNYVGAVQYSISYTSWKKNLLSLLTSIQRV